MERIWLELRAPFAAYRDMQAGVFRPSAPIMTPSAAYGLVLNLAAIDARDPASPKATRMRGGLPSVRVAIGTIRPPEVSTLYQQLHTYPVGNSGKQFEERAFGRKYWIAPVRRQVLVDLHLLLGVEAPPDLVERVRRGLSGDLNAERYGLPFAGDNNFLFDRIVVLVGSRLAKWWTPVRLDEVPRSGSYRLSVDIDRDDNSRSRSVLMAPGEELAEPPAEAWQWTPRGAPNG